MGEYVQQFMDQSTKLTRYVRNQLEKVGLWSNVPGALEKIAVSDAGYVWGYNSQMEIYSCKDPCTGKWTGYGKLDGTFSSVAADKSRVYFLMTKPSGARYVAVRDIDGGGTWTLINVPDGSGAQPGSEGGVSDLLSGGSSQDSGDAFRFNSAPGAPSASGGSSLSDTIEVTDSFIFVGSQSCAKPCATNNWVVNEKTKNANAASSNHVYIMHTTDDGREIMRRSDASAQGGWDDLDGLKGVTPFTAHADNTAIYGVDKKGEPVRCVPPYDKPSSCKKLDTGGRKPKSMSVNPANNALYMTTVEPGPAGNIFHRLDSDNSGEVISYSDDVVKDLDRDVNSLGNEIRVQNSEIAAANNIKEASKVIHDATDVRGPLEKSVNDRQKLRSQIMGSSEEARLYTSSLMPLQVLVVTLVLLLIVFAVVGFVLPTSVTTGLGVLILASGFGTAIYFVVNNQ
jgi:hypothetical protein